MSTEENEFRKVQWTDNGWQPSDDDGPDGMPLQPPRGPGLSAENLELLKLAARAIGAVRIEEVDGEAWLNLHFADGSIAWNWNPLLHGDDTFNLAVDLNMNLDISWRGGRRVSVMGDGAGHAEEPFGEDKRAAAKRAVTRAAAEIGKAMQ
jgi:hypothetical protein